MKVGMMIFDALDTIDNGGDEDRSNDGDDEDNNGVDDEDNDDCNGDEVDVL